MGDLPIVALRGNARCVIASDLGNGRPAGGEWLLWVREFLSPLGGPVPLLPSTRCPENRGRYRVYRYLTGKGLLCHVVALAAAWLVGQGAAQ